MKKLFGLIFTIAMFLCLCMQAQAFTVATGPTDGYYHNGLFDQFTNALKRASGKDAPEVKKYDPDNGTDGTAINIKLVNEGKADVAFAQLDGALLQPMDNAEIMGIIMYEVGNFTYAKGSKVDECDDLRSGNVYTVGMNKMGGTKITFDAMAKTDPKLARANVMDYDVPAKAINDMTRGELQSYMFVSVPTSPTVSRMVATPEIRFGDCWDSNYKDLKVNGKPVYTKVSLGKGDGYPNSFDTFRVPTVVIANKAFLAANKKFYNLLFDATTMAYGNIQAEKKFKFYPEK